MAARILTLTDSPLSSSSPPPPLWCNPFLCWCLACGLVGTPRRWVGLLRRSSCHRRPPTCSHFFTVMRRTEEPSSGILYSTRPSLLCASLALLLFRLQVAAGWQVTPLSLPLQRPFQQSSCRVQRQAMPCSTTVSRTLGFWSVPLMATTTSPEAATETAVSFVQTELRKEAMRLHTRDQAKEGEQEAQTPFTKWEPKRQDYLQFLVDSKLVYEAIEDIVKNNPKLAAFRNTGLERAQALEKDIEWFVKTHSDVTLPAVGPKGTEYAALLREMAAAPERLPAFMCHYYNFYFAHTAGGRMIGKKMAAMLLDDYELEFYKWEGDVKELLDGVRRKIDAMAATWTATERETCVKETKATFMYGGSLLGYIAGGHGH